MRYHEPIPVPTTTYTTPLLARSEQISLFPYGISEPDWVKINEKANRNFEETLPQEHAEWKKRGHVTLRSRVFPVIYSVLSQRIEVVRASDEYWIGHICVGVQRIDVPIADKALQLCLMLKWNEEYVLRLGNWFAQDGVKAWPRLCVKYPLYAARHYALQLLRQVLSVLSACISSRR